MKDKLTPNVKYILDKLNNNGYLAYLVGGAVRDVIMGKTPGDFDITTSATPNEVIQVFKGEVASTNGLKHGTVGVKHNSEYFEITTFRTETTYKDNRHPDEVTFVLDYYMDAKRRDFTINAIAYDHINDRYLDYFNGIDDIQNKVIRCVGNPMMRFEEDALRILRAVRFASVLGFTIDAETEEAMFQKEHLLTSVAIQRINIEICKAIEGENFPMLFEKYFCIYRHGLPRILANSVNFKALKPFSEKIIFDLVDNLSLIFSEEASKCDIYQLLIEKSFSKAISKKVYDVCYIINGELDKNAWKKAFINYPIDVIESANKCAKAKGLFTLDKDLFNHYKNCCKRTELKVNGNDIYQVINNKNEINDYTIKLLEAVMDNKVSNSHDELLRYLEELKACKNS